VYKESVIKDGNDLFQLASVAKDMYSHKETNIGHPTLSCTEYLAKPDLHIKDQNNGETFMALTANEPKFQISLHSSKFDDVRWGIYERGEYYETELTKMVQESLRRSPGSILLDVGANIGWFSLVGLAEGHEVVAFEPHPLNYKRLCESIQVNKWDDRISLYPYGVGDVHGESLTLHTGMGGSPNPGGFSFKEAWKSHRTKEFNTQVKIVSLDGIADEKGWFHDKKFAIGFMKVDVEGFESKVYNGATRLLQSGKVKLIEFEYATVGTYEEEDPIEILRKQGYCLLKYGFHKGPDRTDNLPKTDENLRDNVRNLANGHKPSRDQVNLLFGICNEGE
jgi:FkbM family methyltransferase